VRQHFVLLHNFVFEEFGFALCWVVIFNFQLFPLFIHLLPDLSDVRLKVFADLVSLRHFRIFDFSVLHLEVLVLVRVLSGYQLQLLADKVSSLVSVSKSLELRFVLLRI